MKLHFKTSIDLCLVLIHNDKWLDGQTNWAACLCCWQGAIDQLRLAYETIIKLIQSCLGKIVPIHNYQHIHVGLFVGVLHCTGACMHAPWPSLSLSLSTSRVRGGGSSRDGPDGHHMVEASTEHAFGGGALRSLTVWLVKSVWLICFHLISSIYSYDVVDPSMYMYLLLFHICWYRVDVYGLLCMDIDPMDHVYIRQSVQNKSH